MDFDLSLISNSIPLLIKGAGVTLEITALAVGFGLLVASVSVWGSSQSREFFVGLAKSTLTSSAARLCSFKFSSSTLLCQISSGIVSIRLLPQ